MQTVVDVLRTELDLAQEVKKPVDMAALFSLYGEIWVGPARLDANVPPALNNKEVPIPQEILTPAKEK